MPKFHPQDSAGHSNHSSPTQSTTLHTINHTTAVSTSNTPKMSFASIDPTLRRSERPRKPVQYVFAPTIDDLDVPEQTAASIPTTQTKTTAKSRKDSKKTAAKPRNLDNARSKADLVQATVDHQVKNERRDLEATRFLPQMAQSSVFPESAMRSSVNLTYDSEAAAAAHALLQMADPEHETALALLQLSEAQEFPTSTEPQLKLESMLAAYDGKSDQAPALSATRNTAPHKPSRSGPQHPSVTRDSVATPTRRSTRNRAVLPVLDKVQSGRIIKLRYQVRSAAVPKPAIPDDLVPSIANDYKFQSAGSSNLTPAQLDALLKPPVRSKKFPLDLRSVHATKLSYNQIGTMPKAGLADQLVKEIEERHALEVKGLVDDDEDVAPRPRILLPRNFVKALVRANKEESTGRVLFPQNFVKALVRVNKELGTASRT